MQKQPTNPATSCPRTQVACPFVQVHPFIHSHLGLINITTLKLLFSMSSKATIFLDPMIHFYSLPYAAFQQHLANRPFSLFKILPSFNPEAYSLISSYLPSRLSCASWLRPLLFAVRDHSLPSTCTLVTVYV